MPDFVFILVVLTATVLGLWVIFVVPAKMAESRHRDQGFWVLISIFISPVVAIFLLLILGDKE